MDWLRSRDALVRSIQKYRYALLVLALGILLMILPDKDKNKVDARSELPEPTGSVNITEELTQILSQIRGVGRVKVMLTVSAGELTVYQHNEDRTEGESGTVRKETVIVTDAQRNESGLVQQIIPAVYQGALIVCDGGDQPSVCLWVVEAVSKVTGLASDRISVLRMK